MRLKCIGCEALARPVYLCAAQSPHIVDVELFRLGLHADPADLRARLQERIAATSSQGYEAIVMAYGLCGKATHGLQAVDIPIVIPRAHDCITLFLGDRGRYREEFDTCPGTYWYALDYIERREGSGTALSLGSGVESDLPSVYDEYVAKYGKDNADYLMEIMGAWQQHYQRAVFIDMGIGDGHEVEREAQEEATRRGWAYERVEGNLVLIRRLIMGDWGPDFLTVQPGQRIGMTYGHDVMVGIDPVRVGDGGR
ncbi:MAG: DUF1638 domain-containing protein [Chloroflexi bacterium]|nr:DUF1638 domain-containing protein [Chloroflexota bacterium]